MFVNFSRESVRVGDAVDPYARGLVFQKGLKNARVSQRSAGEPGLQDSAGYFYLFKCINFKWRPEITIREPIGEDKTGT